ncbi:MAG: DUF2804 domain-containing protein [Candidatus Hydrogenedentes bacterium]|nr:DUF2804 domain-containing protein [Candidatus Hydrogenedentota bacterium]
MRATYLADHGLSAPIRTEITKETLLCTPGGRLHPGAVGWSRHPQHRCNLSGRFGRKKRWDYWCIMGPKFLLSATVAHVDYLSLGGIYLLEYTSGRFAAQALSRPFSNASVLSDSVGGTQRFESKPLDLHFEAVGESVRIRARSTNLAGRPFQADLTVYRPRNHETLNVVIPWDDRTFQFTSKQHALPTEGAMRWGDERLDFGREDSWGVLDFGRGIWPYSTSWNWAAFSGRSGGDVVGINMGAKWTDGTGANENGIFLNGRMHKLFEDVAFEYDTGDFMKPWRMRSCETDALNLEFTPFYDRHDAANLGILRTEVHQCFGHYAGMLRVDGREIAVREVPGWAEEHFARW